jgi:alpha-glucosidase
VPLPWSAEPPARSWLPAPPDWCGRCVDVQSDDPESVLSLYRRAIALRPAGDFAWRQSPPGSLAFDRDGLTCTVNFAAAPIPLEDVVLASEPLAGRLPAGAAAWTQR